MRASFIVGFQPGMKMLLEHCENCVNSDLDVDHCHVARVSGMKTGAKKSYENTPELKENISMQLHVVKDILKKNPDSLCDVMIHLGLLHYRCQPGEKSVSQFDIRKNSVYERLNEQHLDLKKLEQLPIKANLLRYDITILAKDLSVRLRYKIFIDIKKGEFMDFRQMGMDEREFYSVKIGPGFFNINDSKISRYDIIEPKKNLTTRLNLQIYENTLQRIRK